MQFINFNIILNIATTVVYFLYVVISIGKKFLTSYKILQ